METEKNVTSGQREDSEIIVGPLGDRDVKHRLVRCTECEQVSRCTPDNDFYVVPEDESLLLCERCFSKYCSKIYSDEAVIKITPNGKDGKLGNVKRRMPGDESWDKVDIR